MTTLVLVVFLLTMLVGTFLLWAWSLKLGLTWVNAEGVTFRKAMLVGFVMYLLHIVAGVGLRLIAPAALQNVLLLELIELALLVGIAMAVISQWFGISHLKALLAWLPTLGVGVFSLLVAVLVVRPFWLEAFSVPTNAMAPTILGIHMEGKCGQCGGPAYRSKPNYLGEPPPHQICRDHFHVTEPPTSLDQLHGQDRIAVAKYLKPRRWDLVVFKYPGEPGINYVKRLVGLPGEEITIVDGKVHADSQPVPMPDELSELRYESESEYFFNTGQSMWGAPDNPAQLGENEYFMLGDFSVNSADSRYWQTGADGHPPYAVPESHLVGVVTHTYWPLKRFRVFR